MCKSVIERIPASDILRNHQAERIVELAVQRRAGFLGHTIRTDDDRMVKRVLLASDFQMTKASGSLLDPFPGSVEDAFELAEDRDQWREFWKNRMKDGSQPRPAGEG